MKNIFIVLCGMSLFLSACKEPKEEGPYLIFKVKLDSTQVRLNSFGQPVDVPADHEAQTPDFKGISVHYIELSQSPLTAVGAGAVLYKAAEVETGGTPAKAIDFAQETIVNNGEVFFKIPLKDVAAGTYQYLRASLAYQAYEVQMYFDTTITYNYLGTDYTGTISQEFPCYVSSFIGFNTYIQNLTVKDTTIAINANKLQGFWATKTYGTANVNFSGLGTYPYPVNVLSTGQAPAGATTVVNPLFDSSPIPAGSCLVTGPFENNSLVITGDETSDVTVEMSLSINKSFEWTKVVADGKYEPFKGEMVVDMGVRGMIARILP